jgi:hypothetical protein
LGGDENLLNSRRLSSKMAEAVAAHHVSSGYFSQDACDGEVLTHINCVKLKKELQKANLEVHSDHLMFKLPQEENNPAIVQQDDSATSILNDSVVTKSGLLCSCCKDIKLELENTKSELQTSRVIIKLLQEEITYLNDTYSDIRTTTESNYNSISSVGGNKEDDLNKWKQAAARRQKSKKSHSLQLIKPIPTSNNQFSTLDNLQDYTEDPLQPVLTDTLKTVINKNKCTSKPRKKRITVIGDSHARGCAQELSHLLGKSFEVKGTVMPGSRLENITLPTKKELRTYIEMIL